MSMLSIPEVLHLYFSYNVCKFLKFISCQKIGIDHWVRDTVYPLSLTNHSKHQIYHYTFKASDAHFYVKCLRLCSTKQLRNLIAMQNIEETEKQYFSTYQQTHKNYICLRGIILSFKRS